MVAVRQHAANVVNFHHDPAQTPLLQALLLLLPLAKTGSALLQADPQL